MKHTPKYLGIRGPGIVYIKDVRAFLNAPAAKRQIAAARRIALLAALEETK